MNEKRLELRFSDAEWERLERTRGEVPRATWVKARLSEVLDRLWEPQIGVSTEVRDGIATNDAVMPAEQLRAATGFWKAAWNSPELESQFYEAAVEEAKPNKVPARPSAKSYSGPAGSVRNKRERRRVLESVYGDSVVERGGWIDLDRLDSEIEALLEFDPAQAERWFLNRCMASEGAAFDLEAWKAKVAPRVLPAGSHVVVGVDGALNDDALAVVACDVESGYMWPVGIWERPKDAGPDYEHPRHEVDGAVSELFENPDLVLWRVYCDDQWIEGLIEGWQNRFGERRVVAWRTNRPRQIAWAVRNFELAVSRPASDERNPDRPHLTHSGDVVLTRHVANARQQKLTVLDDRQRPMHTLTKPAQHSPLKIDGAMAAVLAWEALGDALAAGVVSRWPDVPEPEPDVPAQIWTPGTVPAVGSLVAAVEGPPLGELS